MRIFNVAIAIAALFVIGITANPATANCHAKLEAAEEKLGAIPKDMGVRQQIKKMIGNAKKFKNHKKKKKKCKKILKKVNKLLKKAGKQAGKEGIGGCAVLIEKAEKDIVFLSGGGAGFNNPIIASLESFIAEAKEYNAAGKERECVQMAKKAIKRISNKRR